MGLDIKIRTPRRLQHPSGGPVSELVLRSIPDTTTEDTNLLLESQSLIKRIVQLGVRIRNFLHIGSASKGRASLDRHIFTNLLANECPTNC